MLTHSLPPTHPPGPKCHSQVKQSTLSVKSLDDKYADDDATWRKRVLAVYNARTPDFDTLRDYNDYLEEVEDVVFSIVNRDPSAPEHIKKIKAMEQSDGEAITARQAMRAEEDRQVVDALAAERTAGDRRRLERAGEEEDISKIKKRMKQEKLELQLGDRDQLSLEMKEAAKVGVVEAVRNNLATVTPNDDGNLKLIVFEPAGGLRSRGVVNAMGKDAVIARIKSAGSLVKNSAEDHEECLKEALSSMFI